MTPLRHSDFVIPANPETLGFADEALAATLAERRTKKKLLARAEEAHDELFDIKKFW